MRLSKPYFNFIFAALGIISSGCSYRINKDQTDLNSIFVSRQMMDSVSFIEVKNKVLIPKCISCHGNSGGVNLENYSAARSHLDAIAQSTLIKKTMPKAGNEKLTPEEYLLLAAWVKAGGPETPLNGTDVPPPAPVEILKPEFTSIKKLIIDRKCLSCHKPGGEAPRVPLNTPEEMIDSPLEIIIPGNADESGFIMTLDWENSTKPMPPKKSGITPVSAEEIEIIKQWINNGAKD